MKMDIITIGIILLLIGFIFIIIGSISSIKGKTDVKSAGIVFIGPFPIGWASDKKMFYILIAITIIAFIILYLLTKK